MTQSTQQNIRDALVMHGRSLFERGFTVGTSGNLSARVPGGFLVTPTNSCLGRLEASQLSLMDESWKWLSGSKPTKEISLHRAMYDSRPATQAVVHLHSTYATAISLLEGIDPTNALPPITPYAVMRLGRVAIVPYTAPGSDEVVKHILALQGRSKAILLGNHGPVVADKSLDDAVAASEELEETCRLLLITHGMKRKLLSAQDVDYLASKLSM
jgi:3-dehydro-4-phosphotetronate decarboxylase